MAGAVTQSNFLPSALALFHWEEVASNRSRTGPVKSLTLLTCVFSTCHLATKSDLSDVFAEQQRAMQPPWGTCCYLLKFAEGDMGGSSKILA